MVRRRKAARRALRLRANSVEMLERRELLSGLNDPFNASFPPFNEPPIAIVVVPADRGSPAGSALAPPHQADMSTPAQAFADGRALAGASSVGPLPQFDPARGLGPHRCRTRRRRVAESSAPDRRRDSAVAADGILGGA
jgi:hypothetical protein